ncbi:MAG: DNA helicase RecG [Candidatus Cloacimonetes bacterium HGW-Cloacimonetes-1]|jgi:ATP-dependent DNA helicase RecG|nr:MAG: DNA helicase RecG [Candidatus Cloacimonetes bacterium HGW-Cloacimonetes-1]
MAGSNEYEKNILMPVKFLRGIGEYRARALTRLGVQSILDLMELFPKAYIQRQMNTQILNMNPGDRIAITAMISWKDIRVTASNRNQLNIGISDGRAMLVCTWFKYPKSYEELLTQGSTIWVSGIVSEFNGQLQLIHPDFELIDNDSTDDSFWKDRPVLPVYPLTATFSQNMIRKYVYNAFWLFATYIEENLPPQLLAKHQFPNRKDALQMMHFTTHPEQIESIRYRFVYEELFYTQILWARHRHFHITQTIGISFENKKHLTTQLFQSLAFTLTNAQKRVIREIFADMTSDRQMSRLLQGDVGSGKTIVTLFAMLLAVENGYQAALMAPTEILAEQHFGSISRLLENIPLKICLLKGGAYKGKAQQKEEIAAGEINIVIGTHAIIQADIRFARLGFAAVDEQHRFGVEQRAKLARKDEHPDLLYLSATPIPRSLSMTVYGDLEVSVLDELPPNRKPVLTKIRSNAKIDLVFAETRKELAKGRQVYIVCPLIEESDKIDLIDAQRLYAHVSQKVFTTSRCAILHGKMKNAEKEEIMHAFKDGEIHVLVSTTVIEVGVDVPNATVMIIEHAERFGLAQMHQLRGRVGRGAEQSICYLIEHFPISEVGRQRLATMADSNDGFLIAEKDLELRGPGDFFGTEQSGMPQFRFANIMRDQAVLQIARNDAFEIIAVDPEFVMPENAIIKRTITQQLHKKEELIQY